MTGSAIRNWMWWLPVVILVAVRLHNGLVTPGHYGFDAYGHMLYLEECRTGTVPLANEGWQNYHPPLFPWLSARVAALLGTEAVRTAQWVSTFASLIGLSLVMALARRLCPAQAWYAVLVMAMLPADLCTAATVYNLPLAYCLSTLFLWMLVAAWEDQTLRPGREVLLGLVAAAGAMTRPDASILPLMLGLLWLARLCRHTRSWRDTTLAALLAGSVSLATVSWFFLRNLAVFGRPIVIANDEDLFPIQWAVRSGFSLLPGFHTLAFYWSPTLAIFSNPFNPSALASMPSAWYASIWWRYWDVASLPSDRPLGIAMLVGGLVPTMLLFVGAWQAGRNLGRWWPVLGNLLLAGALNLTVVVVNPIFVAVKGFYMYTAFAAGALCVGRGAAALTRRWPGVQLPLQVWLTALALVSAWACWFPG